MDFADSLVQAVPGGVVHVLPDGSVRMANPEALRILGLKFDELTERYIVDFETETILDDGSPCPAAAYPVAVVLMTQKASGPLTIGVKRPDGTICWAVFRAQPVFEAGVFNGAVVTFLDVSSRKEVEDALRRSEERWRNFSEHSPDFLLTTSPELVVRSINRMLPDQETTLVGRSIVDYIDPPYANDWRGQAELARETRKPVRFETRGRSDTGILTWYETYLVPLVDDDVLTGFLIVGRDVTERRKMLASIAEKDRLANVGMLASSIAHEVMNPLTYMLANLELAAKVDGERRDKAITSAREGATRMQQVVYDLRSLGRTGAEELFYVDVRTVFETALRLCGPQIGRRAKVELALGEVPGVLASESRLCQVFINLLTNASQATTTDESISIHVRTRHEGDFVGVEIEDNGEGIAPESVSRVFEPFFTTKREGTGLGLSICRDIIERMGGRIDLKSTVGEGTNFTVWLSTNREPTRASESRAGDRARVHE